MSRTNGSSSASAFNVSPWAEEQGPESFAKSHPLAPSLVRDGARHQATPGVRRKQERRRSEQRRDIFTDDFSYGGEGGIILRLFSQLYCFLSLHS
jgi:hypothetical protein